jgi:TetR/AcrR family transcriptional regulator, regulator of cefoperazone and chloramphenicol sensitivity
MLEQDDTRMRLLMAATQVFAEHGYHAATTREICRRASANLAAIHYHFGDKAELYRAVFKLPLQAQTSSFGVAGQENVTLDESLTLFYRTLMAPLLGDSLITQQFMRLHAREEIDPSGVLGDVVAEEIRPNFERLQQLLCRELKLKQADADIDRLAFCLVGIAKIFFHGNCLVSAFSPELIRDEKAINTLIEKFVSYAKNMIAAEAAVRNKK